MKQCMYEFYVGHTTSSKPRFEDEQNVWSEITRVSVSTLKQTHSYENNDEYPCVNSVC